jgi:hypothetical protein
VQVPIYHHLPSPTSSLDSWYHPMSILAPYLSTGVGERTHPKQMNETPKAYQPCSTHIFEEGGISITQSSFSLSIPLYNLTQMTCPKYSISSIPRQRAYHQ